MIFEQIYLDCLSQASYLIGSGERAVVVDPRRDVDVYLDAATRHGLDIEHVIATHLHGDFVAGLVELADRTGATVWMGERFDGPLPCERLADGQELRIGSVTIRTLETPGHTPESICLLVTDDEAPHAAPKLLTGDTVFIGDVGRPDLVGAQGHSAEEMAGMMFDSLAAKILPLDDHVEVWPGHGADSTSGTSIGTQASSTIGTQRVQNWAFRQPDRARFVAEQCANLAPPPGYFQHAATVNREGPRLSRERPQLRELAEDECSVSVENGALLLDVRPVAAFGAGHVPNALNIGLAGRFAEWSGKLIEPGRRIVVIAADEEQAREAFVRLARVGHDMVIGWCRAKAERTTDRLQQQDVHSLRSEVEAGSVQVVDVRGPGEFSSGHVPGAVLAPLDRLPGPLEELDRLDRARPTAIVSAKGDRSSSAAHFLRQRGFQDVRNVAGGTDAWRATGYAVET